MSANGHPNPTHIRSRMSHPVIDADGHWLEYGPAPFHRLEQGTPAAEPRRV
jgi:hypothetical protein